MLHDICELHNIMDKELENISDDDADYELLINNIYKTTLEDIRDWMRGEGEYDSDIIE